MAMPSQVDAPEDMGLLANNYIYVQGLQTSLSRSDMNMKVVPEMLEAIIEDEAWRAFRLPDGRIVRNPADFRRFIESPRPEGCQTPIHVLRRMVAGSDVADAVEELLRGTPGAPVGSSNNPNGRPKSEPEELNRNNITDKFLQPDPVILSLPAPVSRKRDYSRESKQGTSVGYVLRRLEKDAPEYLDRVKAGELSPNGAAVAAGLFDKKITIPAVPRKAARVLARHFRGDDLAELVDLLTNALADETNEGR